MTCVVFLIGTQDTLGIQGKSCREVSNRAQRTIAYWYGWRELSNNLGTDLARPIAHDSAGEDRKLAVKALASILKGLGLHHEAAAVLAKN